MARRIGPFALAATTADLLGGGISRHGASCGCRYCAAPAASPKARRAIPVVTVRDEVLLATRRYNAMSRHDHERRALPADAWRAIAGRLDVAATLVSGDNATFVRDRANDARRMARAADHSATEPA